MLTQNLIFIITQRRKYMVRLKLSGEVSKKETDDQCWRLHDLYPEDEWLHVFTDGSMLTDCINAGSRVFCNLLSFYSPVRRYKTAFDAEISTIQIALSQLQCQSENFPRAAFLAISTSETPDSADILNCCMALNDLTENHKEVALQWVPAHCGLQGNETADSLAKEATRIIQITDKPIPFYTAKRLIIKSFREAYWENIKANKDKKWIEEITNIPLCPRDRSVATFCLVTGHNCLSKHLYHIKMPSPLCQQCNIQEEMDAPFESLPCTGRLWERCWRALRKMNDL